MSRLEFGPQPKEMEVTDIKTGHFVFAPVDGKDVSYASLDTAVTGAGYDIESAVIVISGTLNRARHLVTPGGQIFHLTGVNETLNRQLGELEPGAPLRVEGAWKAENGAEIVAVSSFSIDQAEGAVGENPR